MRQWRNWQTRKIKDLVVVLDRGGSSPLCRTIIALGVSQVLFLCFEFVLKKQGRTVLYPVKVTLKKIKISLYGLIAEVLRGEVVSFAGNLDCVEVFNTLLNQIFQFCQSLRM